MTWTKALIAALAPLALASPALAQVLSPYDKAVQDRQAGRTTLAISELQALAAKAPMDADVLLNLGLAYTAKGDFKAAEAVLARGLEISPDYVDMRLAYARVAFYRGQPAEARRRLTPLLAARPAGGDAQDLLKQIAAAEQAPVERPWRVDATASYSRLSNGIAPWREWDIAAGRQLEFGTGVSVALEQTSRFGQSNTYVSGTVSQRVGRGAVFIAYGGSPNATYRARHAIQAGFTAPPLLLPDKVNLVGEVDVSWSHYPAGVVYSIQPAATLNLTDALSATARYVHTVNERRQTLTGYIFTANATLASRYHFSAGYASAPDSSAGVTVNVESYSFGAAIDLTSASTLRLNTTHEDRGTYTRDDYVLGLTHRF